MKKTLAGQAVIGAALAAALWMAPSAAQASARLGGAAARAVAGARGPGPGRAGAGAAVGYLVPPAVIGSQDARAAAHPRERAARPPRRDNAALAEPQPVPLPKPKPSGARAEVAAASSAPPVAAAPQTSAPASAPRITTDRASTGSTP